MSLRVTRRHRFVTNLQDAGLRLDQLIARHAPGVSRGLARRAISSGCVFVDRKRVKVASRAPRAGQEVTIHWGALAGDDARVREADPSTPPAVLAETDDYLVIDKPSGLFSAPTPEGDRSDVLFHLRDYGDLHLVHRLDRPTSGLMVVARTPASARLLGEQLQRKTLGRRYVAILAGTLPRTELRVEEPIAGRPAVTRFQLLEQKKEAALVVAELETGRTHQIRIHAEGLGCPVAGDSKYGRAARQRLSTRSPRLALHARDLWFEASSGEMVSFHSPVPGDLLDYWAALSGR